MVCMVGFPGALSDGSNTYLSERSCECISIGGIINHVAELTKKKAFAI